MKSNPEQALCDALEAAGRDYQQAVRSMESISRDIADGSAREQAFGRLQEIAVATRETEMNVTRLREIWTRLGQRPGDRLQSVLSRQAAVLRELIRSLDEAEQLARASRGNLIHAIDHTTRSQRMHTAYARTIRQAAE